MYGYRPDKPTERALAAYTNLVRAADTVETMMSRQTESFGLTLAQFRALEALLHLGSMGQVTLGEKMFSTEGNTNLVVTNLEKRGLVRRERIREGRSKVRVHLTKEGIGLVEKVFPLHATVIRAQMSALTWREQEVLRRLCRKLGHGDAVEFIKVMIKVGTSDGVDEVDIDL